MHFIMSSMRRYGLRWCLSHMTHSCIFFKKIRVCLPPLSDRRSFGSRPSTRQPSQEPTHIPKPSNNVTPGTLSDFNIRTLRKHKGQNLQRKGKLQRSRFFLEGGYTLVENNQLACFRGYIMWIGCADHGPGFRSLITDPDAYNHPMI